MIASQLPFPAPPLRLVIAEGGSYGCGYWYKLPSGWCLIEIAVHYGDRR